MAVKWFGSRKGIWPVKTDWLRYWHGYLSAARCKWFAYGPVDVTATPSSLAPVKSRMVHLSGAGFTRVVLEKRPLNGRSVVVVVVHLSSERPTSGFSPTRPGRLMWSLMMTKSPTLYAGFIEPHALVTINTSAPRSATTRTGNVTCTQHQRLRLISVMTINRLVKLVSRMTEYVTVCCLWDFSAGI